MTGGFALTDACDCDDGFSATRDSFIVACELYERAEVRHLLLGLRRDRSVAFGLDGQQGEVARRQEIQEIAVEGDEVL